MHREKIKNKNKKNNEHLWLNIYKEKCANGLDYSLEIRKNEVNEKRSN